MKLNEISLEVHFHEIGGFTRFESELSKLMQQRQISFFIWSNSETGLPKMQLSLIPLYN